MKFELSLEEVNLVLAGLSELPAKQSLSLILKLQEEASAQIKAKNEAEKQNKEG